MAIDIENILKSLANRTSTKRQPIATPGQKALMSLVDSSTAPEDAPIHTPEITTPPAPDSTPMATPPDPSGGGEESKGGGGAAGMLSKIAGGMSGDAPASGGGLGGALGGMAGAIDTSPPNMAMPPQDYPQNPIAQSLAQGSALRKLAGGGIVDPGQTVEVGDGGDGSGAEILHIDKDGKAIVLPLNDQAPEHNAPPTTQSLIAQPPAAQPDVPQPNEADLNQLTAISQAARIGDKYGSPPQPQAVAGLANALPPNPTSRLPQDYARPELTGLNQQGTMPVTATTAPTSSGMVMARPPTDLPQAPDLTPPPAPVDPNPLPPGSVVTNDAPYEADPEKYYQQKYLDAISPKKRPKLLGALYGALQGMTNEQLGTNNPIKTLDDLQRDRANRQYGPILQAIGQQKAAVEAKNYRDAQIAHLKAQADSERENADTSREWRQNQHADKVQQQGDIALRTLLKLKHVDPSDTAHAALMVQAGLNPADVKGWDDRKIDTKQINGVTYKLNNDTHEYEQTNLPKDEAKTLVPYEVTMPDGERRTYKVAQKDAAGFSTQVTKLGMSIQATGDRQDKTIAFNKEKEAALNTYRGALLDISKQRVALAASGDTRGAARLDDQQKALRARLLERVQQGKLSQQDFDNIFAKDAGFGSATGDVEKPQ